MAVLIRDSHKINGMMSYGTRTFYCVYDKWPLVLIVLGIRSGTVLKVH